MGYGSLARVLTAWTGTIAWSGGDGPGGELTPRSRESVASLVARLVSEMVVSGESGSLITVSVSAAGVVTIAGSAADLAFTGTCATRTAFTGGPYVGGSDFTAAGSFSGAYVPAYGLRLASPLLATGRGSSVGDGSAGTSPIQESAGSRLVCWDSAISVFDLSHEWDVWYDGRVFGRFYTRNMRRVPLSTIRSVTTTRIEIDAIEVA